jgi:hypothetical protein
MYIYNSIGYYLLPYHQDFFIPKIKSQSALNSTFIFLNSGKRLKNVNYQHKEIRLETKNKSLPLKETSGQHDQNLLFLQRTFMSLLSGLLEVAWMELNSK